MSQRRRRRQQSDVSSGDEEDVVWSENSDSEVATTDTEEGRETPESGTDDVAEEKAPAVPETADVIENEPSETEEVFVDEDGPDEDMADEDIEVTEEKEKSDEESPTHVPKRGNFYQHDDRNYVNPGAGDDSSGRGRRAPRIDSKGRQWGGGRNDKKMDPRPL